ncbi:hypothetical protein TYRP_021772 [Tyrophagus putrescentiae]|nr:hypothetical protein TYRP_021772 [Tyrophagus putrescentiae]
MTSHPLRLDHPHHPHPHHPHLLFLSRSHRLPSSQDSSPSDKYSGRCDSVLDTLCNRLSPLSLLWSSPSSSDPPLPLLPATAELMDALVIVILIIT